MTVKKDINIKGKKVPISNYQLLSHEHLANVKERFGGDGEKAFRNDFKRGALDGLRGNYIAYQKSTPCGIHRLKSELKDTADGYYGISSLKIFKIPMRDTGLECSVRDALN